ncbi:hypothetical protein [Phaeobacter sp. HF9A]|uniref:hypothetical protein n=1 Tax=Phaeobacter sp. HF9A TaxID=2721561 RepID=UPI00143223E1|nr:hypothetical protein [Phaeobacter sp. HF9A]NIZ13097.1 hypothetical protein [Phaeobacter sp. HF9A]
MSSIKQLCCAALCMILPATASHAQGAAAAEARARLVCGSGTLVSATYLPGGLLQATCRQNTPNSTSNAGNANSGTGGGNGLGTGGLGGTGIAGTTVAVGVALTVISSGGDTATTTTEASAGPTNLE